MIKFLKCLNIQYYAHHFVEMDMLSSSGSGQALAQALSGSNSVTVTL